MQSMYSADLPTFYHPCLTMLLSPSFHYSICVFVVCIFGVFVYAYVLFFVL